MVVTSLSDLSFLSGLTELTTLRLMGSVAAEDLTAIKNLTDLQELEGPQWRTEKYGWN